MEIIKFYQEDFWKDATLIESTEHENFTAENTQHSDFNKAWRSQNGAGSGWGRFDIGSTNNKLDFQESDGIGELTATLTIATYNADTLAAEIKTRLDAAGTAVYTVTYSDTTNKFTITSDGAGGVYFKLLWNTGTNTATSVGTSIGFNVTADDTGVLTYIADYMRIHTVELLVTDLTSAKDIYAACIRGHNIESGATIKIQFSADNFSSIAEEQAFTIQDDILVYEWDTAKTYRYVRIYIEDVDNADGYVSLGTIYVGGQFQPGRSFHALDITPEDPSINMPAEGGPETSQQFDHYDIRSYGIRIKGSSDLTAFEAMFADYGKSKPLFICDDPASPLTETRYVKFASWSWRPIRKSTYFWDLSFSTREMR